MNLRSGHGARLAAALLLLVLAALFVGCSAFGGDQNTFNPEGDVAKKQLEVFYWALVPAVIILILVTGVLLYAVVRFRRRSDDDPIPKQVHGNFRLEIAWTIAPTIVLLALAVPMIAAIIDLGGDPDADALHVNVTAQQFSWLFEYPSLTDAEGTSLRSSVDELYIPVDREIVVHLDSVDVNHSFWVPKLAGKLDVIPGRTNDLKFNATSPGTFSGLCAEYCGIGHPDMKFKVIALEEPEFQAWCEEQLALEPGAPGCQR